MIIPVIKANGNNNSFIIIDKNNFNSEFKITVSDLKNIELLNNKFLKLEPIPIVDSKSYFRKDLLISKIEK